jgi:hypothetical protein
MKPLITINNNGSIVTREMTDEEFEQVLADEAFYNELKESIEEKKNQRIALLDKLGITEEEAKLLLS